MDYFSQVFDRHPDVPTVVVGHHPPSRQSLHPQYSNSRSGLNHAYYSSLDEFILDRPQIQLWTCGHTHVPHRYYIGDTLVACNPRGYHGHESCADNFELKYIDLDQLPDHEEVAQDWDWRNP